MKRINLFWLLLIAILPSYAQVTVSSVWPRNDHRGDVITVDPSRSWGPWDGWGSSLAWWGRAIGGSGNADSYADLIYTTGNIRIAGKYYPGLGFNIVRYNVGGGGINQHLERKSPRNPWHRDMHSYWQEPENADPHGNGWNWELDASQRSMMLMAKLRGANRFEMFSDSPPWWMNKNRSTAGSDTGEDCLDPAHYDQFVEYLAVVAKYAREHWAVNFESIEPFNEPSAEWWKFPGTQEGCHFDVATQRTVIPKLRNALDVAGLGKVLIATSDENSIDVALDTWNKFDNSTHSLVGALNVHGYFSGTHTNRGANMPLLREATGGSRRLWMSEYGDDDSSGLKMAQSILQDIRRLRPTAWIYWQPVEPELSGWGLINATYIENPDDGMRAISTPLARINRKFFVLGQFTRYIREGFQMIDVDEQNSIAAYNSKAHQLVIITLNEQDARWVRYDLSRFSRIGSTVTRIATTTTPGKDLPDYEEKEQPKLKINGPQEKRFESFFYPNMVQTFVLRGVYP